MWVMIGVSRSLCSLEMTISRSGKKGAAAAQRNRAMLKHLPPPLLLCARQRVIPNEAKRNEESIDNTFLFFERIF